MKFDEVFDIFLKLETIFSKYNKNLYLVGGVIRDYLLDRDIKDVDICGDALIEDIETFDLDIDVTFALYGCVKIRFENITFEYTTLRKEKAYLDYRHPKEIEFVNDIKVDFLRRDFTINGLYMDKNKKIYDFSSGVDDIKYHLIRTIGDPKKRIKEDPLRILRALRFSLLLDFDIEESLYFAIIRYSYLLDNLNKDKIKQEINKMLKENISPIEIRKQLRYLQINLSKDIDLKEIMTYGSRTA